MVEENDKRQAAQKPEDAERAAETSELRTYSRPTIASSDAFEAVAAACFKPATGAS